MTLMLISQAVFLLERGQTDRRDWTPYPTPGLYSRRGYWCKI